jgi:hypothetical protein
LQRNNRKGGGKDRETEQGNKGMGSRGTGGENSKGIEGQGTKEKSIF